MLAHLWLWLGRWASAKGLSSVAESCYRIASEGGGSVSAEALLDLGKSQSAKERFDEAIATLLQASKHAPRLARVWCALGVAYRRSADMPAARDAYERALEIDPNYQDARTNLGEWHLVSGNPQLALQCFDAVLDRQPAHYEALTNRIAALIESTRYAEAEQAAHAALGIFPGRSMLYVNLANVYAQLAKGREAVAACRKALELEPESEEAALTLATLLGEWATMGAAVALIKKQILVRGESVDRLCRLAMAQLAQKAHSDARLTCEKVLAKQPDQVAAMITLGNTLGTCGDPLGALQMYEKAIHLRPDLSSIHSNVLFESNYLGNLSREEVYRRHAEWAERHELPLLDNQKCTRRPDDPGEDFSQNTRLKIGYVSGDFLAHPVGFLILDVLRGHDRTRFDVHCYSQTTGSDHITEQIKAFADQWRESFFLNDEALANQIVGDRIDILVDLSGHTARNRLKVFAMRPAPVQASWIGYFHSSGLRSIDYFITDPYSTPPDSGQLFSEAPAYLPHTRFCYSPPGYAPPVSNAPVTSTGTITFGSLNRLSKLSDQVIQVWAQILLKLPGSRLLLKSWGLDDNETAEQVRRRFLSAGIASERLELRGSSQHPEMLRQYGDIDIALDPFPFNGGMTTLEALWMGVPVIALAGASVVSRQSASALINVGLGDLVFPDLDSYVAGAVALAGDTGRLTRLRHELRMRIEKSPLCQPEQFVADLEMLYRRMWQAWSRGEKLGKDIMAAPPVIKRTVLHVGCGGADRRSLPQLFQRGWQEIRLDINPDVNPDVIASMLDMSPVASASVDAVFSSHNIEHLHPHEVGIALNEFRRVLNSEGVLVITCPDLQPVCALVAADNLEEMAYLSPAGPIAPIDMLYGHRDAMAKGNLYMAHKTGFTARSLARALADSGFPACRVEKGCHFDLWALAYANAPDEQRMESDKNACFPSQP